MSLTRPISRHIGKHCLGDVAIDQNLLASFVVTNNKIVVSKVDYYGFSATGTNDHGSVSPTKIVTMIGDEDDITKVEFVGSFLFQLGAPQTSYSQNTAFKTLKVGSTSLASSAATFSSGTGFARWSWSVSNPLGTTEGATINCQIRSD